MRYTLLELTQRILDSMDSDEVNSISDTAESLSVANIIKECYFDIIGKMDLPEKEGIFQLVASGDNLKPTVMTLPESVMDLKVLKYNTNTLIDPLYSNIYYVDFEEFLRRSHVSLNSDDIGTMEIEGDNGTFLFKFMNDRHPSIYTSFDDRTILFDAFDKDLEDTLESARTLCYGSLVGEFELEDDYVPDIDPRQFQFLLQASKAQAFVELKQVENPKAEKKERRNEILAQRTKNAIDKRGGSRTYRGYGRRGNRTW